MAARLKYDEVYTLPWEDTDEERFRSKCRSGKASTRYRLKTIDMGETVDAEIYPIWDTQTKRRIESTYSRTAEEEREIYERRMRKYIRRLINANFTRDDTWFTGTFTDAKLPKTMADAQRFVTNFLRRVKYWAKKQGLKPLKRVYAIEFFDVDGLPVRCNVHIVLNVADRDAIERLWDGGGRTQARRLQPDDFGLTGMAMYVIKASQKGKKAYGYSNNLTKPEKDAKVSDNKISKNKARRMVCDRLYAETTLKKLYPGLRLLRVSVYHNDVIDGFYISAQFHRDNFANKNKTERRKL